MMNGEDMNQK